MAGPLSDSDSWGLLRQALHNRHFLLSLRVVVGGTFLLAGAGKLPHSWELFIGLPDVLRFLQVPESLWWLIRLDLLPWIEIAVGACLILGLMTRAAALVSLLLVTAFLVFNGVRLVLGVEYCNCFGAVFELSLPATQIIDVVLLLMSLGILFSGGRGWSLDSLLRMRFVRVRSARL